MLFGNYQKDPLSLSESPWKVFGHHMDIPKRPIIATSEPILSSVFSTEKPKHIRVTRKINFIAVSLLLYQGGISEYDMKKS